MRVHVRWLSQEIHAMLSSKCDSKQETTHGSIFPASELQKPSEAAWTSSVEGSSPLPIELFQHGMNSVAEKSGAGMAAQTRVRKAGEAAAAAEECKVPELEKLFGRRNRLTAHDWERRLNSSAKEHHVHVMPWDRSLLPQPARPQGMA